MSVSADVDAHSNEAKADSVGLTLYSLGSTLHSLGFTPYNLCLTP